MLPVIEIEAIRNKRVRNLFIAGHSLAIIARRCGDLPIEEVERRLREQKLIGDAPAEKAKAAAR